MSSSDGESNCAQAHVHHRQAFAFPSLFVYHIFASNLLNNVNSQHLLLNLHSLQPHLGHSTISQNIESLFTSAALDEYHQLMAAGHFKPATSISLAPSALRTKAPVTPTAAPPRPVPTYGPFPGYAPMQYSPPPPPDSIMRDNIVTRIQTLLQTKLPQWGIPHIVKLSSNLADRIISLVQGGHIGSEGIFSVDDIFIVVGHEGVGRYMALAVVAPVALNILLKGQTWNMKGIDPMKDPVAIEWVRMGFHNLASDQWTRLNDEMRRGSRR
ncbi:hypothetical protein BDU57DRAFT_489410 [Ampelomyces quisqualis]|uniref:Uncharacterized protein n=1 Tax=Ampelomyces quisqualis TaxID=50730 RepID=A0A6A5R6M3_AMPQU|nr:hypothetical protein BDU57DRAFT_489410 [Ampelomyces quisqualis]